MNNFCVREEEISLYHREFIIQSVSNSQIYIRCGGYFYTIIRFSSTWHVKSNVLSVNFQCEEGRSFFFLSSSSSLL